MLCSIRTSPDSVHLTVPDPAVVSCTRQFENCNRLPDASLRSPLYCRLESTFTHPVLKTPFAGFESSSRKESYTLPLESSRVTIPAGNDRLGKRGRRNQTCPRTTCLSFARPPSIARKTVYTNRIFRLHSPRTPIQASTLGPA